MHFPLRITPEITPRCWWPPKNNHLEQKGSGKTNHSSNSIPPYSGWLKANCHNGAENFPFTNNESVDSIQSSNLPRYDTTSLQVLWGDWLNWPRRKCCQDDGAIWPRITPRLPHRPTRKGAKFCKIRRVDGWRYHDGVKADHHFGQTEIFDDDIR